MKIGLLPESDFVLLYSRREKACDGNVLLSGALAGKAMERGSAENAGYRN